MEKFAECVQDSEQLKSALLEMQVHVQTNTIFNSPEKLVKITLKKVSPIGASIYTCIKQIFVEVYTGYMSINYCKRGKSCVNRTHLV